LAVQAGRLAEKQERQYWWDMRRIFWLAPLRTSLDALGADSVEIVFGMESPFLF
jgi:hypothetical protein